MALVTTPGAENAEAYITVAQADAYAQKDVGKLATSWLAVASATTKENLLRRATRDIDDFVQNTDRYYAGEPYEQALLFPRDEDVDDGALVIPARVAYANYLQAAYLAYNGDLLDEAESRRARALTNFAESTISGSVSTDPWFGRLSGRVESQLQEYVVGVTGAWIVTT